LPSKESFLSGLEIADNNECSIWKETTDMSRADFPRVWASLVTALLVIIPGCASSAGQSPFTQTHQLMDTTKALRAANARTLALPRELAEQPLPAYVVEPGDVLLIQPVDLDSPARMPGDQPVLPDGTINLGKYGRLTVSNKTVDEIEAMVKEAVLAQTKDAGFISVRLVSRQSKVYYVLGEVNAPGVFQLSGRETVLDAILAAGGLSERASANNIVLSRPSRPDDCRTVLPVCYKQIVQLGDTSTNYQIAPGDRIYVPGRTFREELFGGKHDRSPCGCGDFHVPCVFPRCP
jgi:polysaccharide export outer membrane protein